MMSVLRLALAVGALHPPPQAPTKREAAPPKTETRPPSLLELALPLPFLA